MGVLVNGEWVDDSQLSLTTAEGKFVPSITKFRNWITRDGSSGFPAEPGRYHLYIANSCPFAHRTLIMCKLKHLEASISISVASDRSEQDGWVLSDYTEENSPNKFRFLYEAYQKSDPTVTCRVSVPVLWDKKTESIVNNESPEIIIMLNNCFDGEDYYPEELRTKIDEIDAWVFDKINIGVYKAGFTKQQEAYEQAVTELFEALDRVEDILSRERYLTGSRFTTADIRIFTTLVRFDVAYYGHFKCNLKRIVDYPNV